MRFLNKPSSPLNDKIEAQDKRIADLEEFIARWNFGDKEKFDEAVKTVAQDVCVQYVDAAEEGWTARMDERFDALDVDDAVEKVLDNKDWGKELSGAIREEVDDRLDRFDFEDKVRDILKDVTITAEISI